MRRKRSDEMIEKNDWIVLMKITERNLSCAGKTVEFEAYGVVDTADVGVDQSPSRKGGNRESSEFPETYVALDTVWPKPQGSALHVASNA